MFDSMRDAAVRGKAGSRRRTLKAWRPTLETLEVREVLSTLILPQTSVPGFAATYVIPGTGEVVPSATLSGGNFLGTYNGTPLTATYCININLPLNVPRSFTSDPPDGLTVTNDGTIYGQAIPNAGAISWLLTNIGPTATTPEQQDALQAAIWNQEYGTTVPAMSVPDTGVTGFQLDGADNSKTPFIEGGLDANAMVADYKADLAALGNNTAPLSNVLWISPNPAAGVPPSPANNAQGLVALAGSTPPPPSTTPDIAITGKGPDAVTLGDTVTYTLTAINTSTVAADGVTVKDTLPQGVTFVSASGGVTPSNGVLTFSLGSLAAGANSSPITVVVRPNQTGTLTDTAVASFNQTDPTPADNTVTLTTTVNPNTGDGPRVTNLARFGFHTQPTTLVLSFDMALNPVTAQNPANYRITGPDGATIAVNQAAYNAANHTVTLFPSQLLNVHRTYRLVVNGTTPTGVANPLGQLLDGAGTGKPGSDYVANITFSTLQGPAPLLVGTGLANRRHALLVLHRGTHATRIHHGRRG